MNSVTNRPSFDRPFPALTSAERYHLEVFGYVIVPDVLSRDECDTVRDALQKLKRDLQQQDKSHVRQPHEAWALINQPHHIFMGGILQSAPCLAAFASHPRLIGMVEELMGGECRLVEFNAHINSRVPDDSFDAEPRYGLHRGTDVPFGSHVKNGLYHCNFIKTLTMLTDLGEDDGGTVVIAGSHKMDFNDAEVIECAYADRSLIHKVVAPAGSTLLFNETLIHATGQIRSDRERAIIIGGYGASMFPYWDGGELTPEFIAQIPPEYQTLFLGKNHWTRRPRYRQLADPVDERRFTLQDGFWPRPI